MMSWIDRRTTYHKSQAYCLWYIVLLEDNGPSKRYNLHTIQTILIHIPSYVVGFFIPPISSMSCNIIVRNENNTQAYTPSLIRAASLSIIRAIPAHIGRMGLTIVFFFNIIPLQLPCI